MEIGEGIEFPEMVDGSGEIDPEDGEMSWIKLRLVNSLREPVARVDYEMVLQDGTTLTRQFDDDGQVELCDIPAGVCELKLPSLTDIVHVVEIAQTQAEAREFEGGSRFDTPEAPERYLLLTGYAYQLVPTWPAMVVDGHIHIMSGNCTPLPPLYGILNDTILGTFSTKTTGPVGRVAYPNRRGLNRIARSVPINVLFSRIGEVSWMSTYEIGKYTVERNNQMAALYGARGFTQGLATSNSAQLGISIVLPMDMDYCHMDGYWGEPIYLEEPPGYWFYHERTSGTQLPYERKRIYLADTEVRGIERQYDEEDGMVTKFMKRWMSSRNPLFKSEAWWSRTLDTLGRPSATMVQLLGRVLPLDLFEPWKTQLYQTERAIIDHPFRLLPMYHYEPRRYVHQDRWRPNTPWHKPFQQLVENGGLHLGFKLYTSQGYKPTDFERLPHQRWFFERCERQNIPIITHCTPSGFYTHHRRFFLDIEEDATVQGRYAGAFIPGPYEEMRQRVRMRYFQENYVHPVAWRRLLEKMPCLRLCLAHFASDDRVWRSDVMRGGKIDDDGIEYEESWSKVICELCKQYDHFYTDISFFRLFDDDEDDEMSPKHRWWKLASAINHYPHLIHKIMFGTDWYMVLNAKAGYANWLRRMLRGLELIQDKLKSELKSDAINENVNLFHQFAIINTFRFYRIAEHADQLRSNMEAKLKRAYKKDHDRLEKLLEELNERYELVKRIGRLMEPVNVKMDPQNPNKEPYGVTRLEFSDYLKLVQP